MLNGDIDNKLSPAIVIDIDNLIIQKSNEKIPFYVVGKQNRINYEVEHYEVSEDIYPLLEYLFYKDISIYFFAHREEFYREQLEKLLNDLPYTRLYLGGKVKRENLLKRKHIHWYFYNDPEHASMLSKNKERWIQHWSEISL
jgi:hypothetical protein